MKISYGNSRYVKHWKNSEITWEDFKSRVSTTQRTTETIEEYFKMGKAQREKIKDIGGYVLGHLKGGHRGSGSVLCRSALALDMDNGTPGCMENIKAAGYTCCVYSTHKNTPKQPRLRVIIPLTRDVSAAEYPAVARMAAKDIGIDLFDDSTYEASRLMYWPSTPMHSEFIFQDFDGKVLDPDEILARYDDWQDESTWPVSTRQSQVPRHGADKAEDPLSKKGIVGAFCRAYTVQEAIAKFLPDVYAPTERDDRFDYIPADSAAGVVIYGDRFAYSHHATDPACGRLLNAFDLVRLQKFRNMDFEAVEGIPITKLPSYKAMADLARQDGKVIKLMLEEKQASAATDFTPEEDWLEKLQMDKAGNVLPTTNNIYLILVKDKRLESIVYNDQLVGMDVRGDIPWEHQRPGWTDDDNTGLRLFLDQNYGIYSPNRTKDALVQAAHLRHYHPVKEYLEALPPWDGVPRVDTLLVDYLGAEDCSYTRAVTRKTLAAAVARVYHPGTKFDSILVLIGPQGIGKSTIYAKLGKSWFSDSLTITDMKDKSAAEKLQGYWILELGEMAGMKKAEVETVKSFVSRQDDKYRASYAPTVESHPRQCIIVGSTNTDTGFLRDITGNRRFWPVHVSGESVKKPWDIEPPEIQQIWAEALDMYRKGEKLYLDPEDEATARREQDNAMETDDREGLVQQYLDTLLPENWDSMDLGQRREFLAQDSMAAALKGTVRRMQVCNMEIWCECFLKDPAAMKKVDSYTIAGIMKKMPGWDKGPRPVLPLYGRQRVYVRTTDKEEQACP